MFMVVQVNKIWVKALVDKGATHSCVPSNVDATLGLKNEAYDSIVTSFNGRDHWVEGIIRFCPLEMGEWVGYWDLIVMHLQDFKMIIMMDFLTQAEVSILPYLRTLAFMEYGMLCTVMVLGNHIIETENRVRLDSLTEHSGGWLDERYNRLAKPWESLGSGQDHMVDDSPQFESTWTSTSFGRGGFFTPFET